VIPSYGDLKPGSQFEEGFTLVELMLALVLSAIIAGTIYSAYISQQKTQLAQEQVAEMQQNLRAATMVIIRDARMAGYDPTTDAGAGITTASVGQLSFTQDVTGGETDGEDNDENGTIDDSGEDRFGDGDTADTGEVIDIGFAVATDPERDGRPKDSDGDGVEDAASLGKQVGGAGGYKPFADNIQAFEFVYLDAAGNATTTLADIRSIRISILARAARPDRDFTNGMTYTPASGVANNWGPYNDSFRRRLLITRVNCRNLGL
jgi:type IV pilus assembly protein PilW